MTTVTFHSREGRITGFTASGHSGYAEAGKDIVCAAVTSAARLAECAVNDVLGLAASVKVRPENAQIIFKLPGGLNEENDAICQTLLAALMVYLAQLHEEYPENLLVLDEEAEGGISRL